MGATARIPETGTLYMPPELADKIILAVHAGKNSVHVGVTKTYEYIRKLMWMPNLKEKVQSVIYHCVVCKMTRDIRKTYAAGSLGRPGLNDMVSADVVGPLTREEHRFSILVMIDHATGFGLFQVIPSKMGLDIVKGLLGWIQVLGPPKMLLTDNGAEFINHQVQQLLERFNITEDKDFTVPPRGKRGQRGESPAHTPRT